LSLEDGIDRMPENLGKKKLQFYAAYVKPQKSTDLITKYAMFKENAQEI
jgi:hypothetical protein